MNNKLVSVVVPVYNVEKYLDRCMKSICEQTYKNIEILLVDDGSTDSSGELCEIWKDKDSRIKVIHKQNQGLGMARNTGINHATGEFICFFDSDDYIELDTIEQCVNVFEKDNVQIVCFGYKEIGKNQEIKRTHIPNLRKYMYVNHEIKKEFLPELISLDPKTGKNSELQMSAWAAMYLTSVIRRHKWYFVSEREIISEDYYSLLELYCLVEKVAILPKVLYCYCENPVSLSRKYDENRYARICHFYKEMTNLAIKLECGSEILHRITYCYFALTIAALKQIESSRSNKKKELIKEILSDLICVEALKSIKNDKKNVARQILFWTMENKWVNICYVLLHLQNRR